MVEGGTGSPSIGSDTSHPSHLSPEVRCSVTPSLSRARPSLVGTPAGGFPVSLASNLSPAPPLSHRDLNCDYTGSQRNGDSKVKRERNSVMEHSEVFESPSSQLARGWDTQRLLLCRAVFKCKVSAGNAGERAARRCSEGTSEGTGVGYV